MRLSCRVSTVAIGLVLAARPVLADQWDRQFEVEAHPKVTVEVDDGHVKVITWDRNQVAVHVDSHGWRIGSHVRPEAVQHGNTIDVSVHGPHGWIGFGVSIGELAIVVSMPKQADLTVRSGDGSVEAGPLAGSVDIRTSDGSITLRDVRGTMLVHSGDGSIEGENLDGALDASTHDGRIHVSGRFDALDVGSGDGRVTAEAGQGSVIRDGWSIHTGDGPLTLRVPAGLKADLEAETGDGSISFDFPIEVTGDWGRSHLHGRMNGGGPPLRLQTGDGSIRVEKLPLVTAAH